MALSETQNHPTEWVPIPGPMPVLGSVVELKTIHNGQEVTGKTGVFFPHLGYWWTDAKGELTHWRYNEELLKRLNP